MAEREVNQFYDKLSPFYHLIYQNWEEGVIRQAKIIDSIIKGNFEKQAIEILDVSCGIGTQSIGLSLLGYKIVGSDISKNAIQRAKEEASNKNLNIEFSVCDMRKVAGYYQREFDLIISCDNSISHLLTDDDIKMALQQFYKSIKRGGGCLITIRDYSDIKKNDVKIIPYGVKVENGKKYIIFQIWTVYDSYYDLDMYFIADTSKRNCTSKVMRTKYNILHIEKLKGLMEEAGFKEIRKIECDYYQPVIMGMK